MTLRRLVAELPEGVEGLCLVRFGLVIRRVSAFGFARRMARRVDRAAAEAIVEGAGLLHAERFAMGWRHVGAWQYWASFERSTPGLGGRRTRTGGARPWSG